MKKLIKISTLLACSLISLNANLITEFDSSNCNYPQERGVKTICKNLGLYLKEAESQTNIRRHITLQYANLEINRLKLHNNMDIPRLEKAIEREIKQPLAKDIVKIDETHFRIIHYLQSSNGLKIGSKFVTIADLVLDYPDLAKRYSIFMPKDKEVRIEDNHSMIKITDIPQKESYKTLGSHVNCRSFYRKGDNVVYQLEKYQILDPIMVENKPLIKNNFMQVDIGNDICWVHTSLID